jgi:hypothetical protein
MCVDKKDVVNTVHPHFRFHRAMPYAKCFSPFRASDTTVGHRLILWVYIIIQKTEMLHV